MGAVSNQVKEHLSFPLMVVWRHSPDIIHQFTQTPTAVLFAAGSCWEGVDFPGDMVSSLIIVRLPFPAVSYTQLDVYKRQLLEDLGVDGKTAAEDACQMEHAVSQKSYEALRKWLSKKSLL